MSKTKLEYYTLPVEGGTAIVHNGPDGVFYHDGNKKDVKKVFSSEVQPQRICERLNSSVK